MAKTGITLLQTQAQRKLRSNMREIFISYAHKGRRTHFFTGKNIDVKYWNKKDQQAKKSLPGHHRFNMFINKRKQKVEDIANSILLEDGNPTIELVRSVYEGKRKERDKANTLSFHQYLEKFINDSKVTKKEGTIKTYRTAQNQLKSYERYAREKLDWHSFDMDFYWDFMEYYNDFQGLTNNGFGRTIKILKAVLNSAVENGYSNNIEFRKKQFRAVKERVNDIYLDEDELLDIINLDLSFDPSLERARDLLIFAAYTGLRFSDLNNLKPENISGNIIRIKTLKTGEYVSIPLYPQAKDVMAKYPNRPNRVPKPFTNQTMNRHLKEIGRLAGIKTKILKIRNCGTKRIEQSLEKYEMITTHTARRSFATNMIKRGLPTRLVMMVTGHTTEAAFNSYIKISNDENAELLLRYFNQNKVGIDNNKLTALAAQTIN
ncbi:site-specific integrase [Aegicerativicinus sediminis]|uniref:site-specific integrase n=1 Tax=Aegicerativicinus sediminis TaxID=2893202 RepID=UPI001E5EED9B|nr:site-specific integrase [Aegicerativicinus sediminis]